MIDMAEKQYVGCLMTSGSDVIKMTWNLLSEEMFVSPFSRFIFSQSKKNFLTGDIVNVFTYSEQYANGDENIQTTCLEYLKDCLDTIANTSEWRSYVKIIINNYKVRKANEIMSRQRYTPNEINEQINETIAQLQALQQQQETKVRLLADVVNENKDNYFKEREIEPIITGFYKFDELTNGLEGGDVIAIGARPSVGKSAFVTQVATNMAERGKTVAIYNLEMKEKQVYERLIAAKSGIEMTRLKKAKTFLNNEQENFSKANEYFENLKIYLRSGTCKPSEVEMEMAMLKPDVIIIDYLQLMRPDFRNSNRVAEVGDISRSIKGIAMLLNIPVIVLVQLNRAVEGRADKKPTLADIRESGDIEQDCSIITFLWNLDDTRKWKGLAVEKNRQGEIGQVDLRFDGAHMTFEERKYIPPNKEYDRQFKAISVNDEGTPFD